MLLVQTTMVESMVQVCQKLNFLHVLHQHPFPQVAQMMR